MAMEESDQKRLAFWHLVGNLSNRPDVAETPRSGGYTQLPEIVDNINARPLIGGGLPTFVTEYMSDLIDWALNEEQGEPPLNQQEALDYFIGQGNLHLGNTEEDTRRLLLWMQTNPKKVINYVRGAWNHWHSDWLTETFEQRLKSGSLPYFQIPLNT